MSSQNDRRRYRNPIPTVDIIIEIRDARGRSGIVLIERKNPPPGWALPGGFVDYGESLESAAVREALEETSLQVRLIEQLGTYSDPARDPRKHTISTVFIARAHGTPVAGDDAANVRIFAAKDIDVPLAFDHDLILKDYFARKRKKGGPKGPPPRRSKIVA
jgi:ADP-ribose pyrophosphatase YjhB (NUDIX family)